MITCANGTSIKDSIEGKRSWLTLWASLRKQETEHHAPN